MTDVLPDFDSLSDALRSLESDSDPAELHGNLCGLMCTVADLDPDYWLGINLPVSDQQPAEARAQLKQLFSLTRAQLDSAEFGFHLLLPADEVGLAVRVEALGNWCQGFLMGLAGGGIQDLNKLPGELPEIAQDMLEISRADSYELADEDEDESAYAELVEYVRMGVLLFKEELQSHGAGPETGAPEQLH